MFDASTFVPSPRPAIRSVRPRPSFHGVFWAHEAVPPLTLEMKGQKLVGARYEQRVADVLSAIYGDRFRRSPVIRYRTNGDHRAIPDGILTLDEWIVIVEVKLAHTVSVWEQLMERYLPLVEILCPRREVRAVEICRSFDPGVVLPGPHVLIESLHLPRLLAGGGTDSREALEVLQWKI